MAKYTKRADGRYETTITITIDGEKKRKHVYGKTIKEVDDKVAELRSQSNKGNLIDDRFMTMEEWAKKWLITYKKGKVSDNTYAGYENAVNVHIIPFIGSKRLQELKKNHLQQVLNKLIDEEKIQTAKKVNVTLGQIVRAALEENYIYKDISIGLQLPKPKQNKKRTLTDKEIFDVQCAELPPKQQAFLYILLYTGMRRGEALALLPTDIDFENKKITISKTLVFGKNQSTVKDTTKSNAGMRVLPLPDRLALSLKKIISDDVLFPSAHGGYMTRTSFRRFWDILSRDAGLCEDVTPHIFRHTYATKLYYGGVDVKTAQYLLGHSSIQVTLEIYTHLADMDSAQIGDVVNNLFS